MSRITRRPHASAVAAEASRERLAEYTLAQSVTRVL